MKKRNITHGNGRDFTRCKSPEVEYSSYGFCFTGLPAIVVAGSAVLFLEGYGTKDL